jgi:anti-sigma factor RsiW
MSCPDRVAQLSAHLDGELSPPEKMDLERHLASCASCSTHFAELRALSKTIRENASRPAPDEERMRRLGESLRAESPDVGGRIAAFARTALVAAAAAVVAWIAAVWWTRPSYEERLADELVAAHVRSLQADHLTDVVSTDRHVVNPWFQGKIDFAVGAHDHKDKGFALEGGRLDYVDGRTVAAVVYRHGPHALNLFVWPTQRDGTDRDGEVVARGFRIVHWSAGGTERWLVSDADATTVKALADLARADG